MQHLNLNKKNNYTQSTDTLNRRFIHSNRFVSSQFKKISFTPEQFKEFFKSLSKCSPPKEGVYLRCLHATLGLSTCLKGGNPSYSTEYFKSLMSHIPYTTLKKSDQEIIIGVLNNICSITSLDSLDKFKEFFFYIKPFNNHIFFGMIFNQKLILIDRGDTILKIKNKIHASVVVDFKDLLPKTKETLLSQLKKIDQDHSLDAITLFEEISHLCSPLPTKLKPFKSGHCWLSNLKSLISLRLAFDDSTNSEISKTFTASLRLAAISQLLQPRHSSGTHPTLTHFLLKPSSTQLIKVLDLFELYYRERLDQATINLNKQHEEFQNLLKLFNLKSTTFHTEKLVFRQILSENFYDLKLKVIKLLLKSISQPKQMISFSTLYTLLTKFPKEYLSRKNFQHEIQQIVKHFFKKPSITNNVHISFFLLHMYQISEDVRFITFLVSTIFKSNYFKTNYKFPIDHLDSDDLQNYYDAIDEALHLIPPELYKTCHSMPRDVYKLLIKYFPNSDHSSDHSKDVKKQISNHISSQVDHLKNTSY